MLVGSSSPGYPAQLLLSTHSANMTLDFQKLWLPLGHIVAAGLGKVLPGWAIAPNTHPDNQM